jgi:hypothetical protein
LSITKSLCVSIHDVAPHTWELCERWRQAIHAVAPIPLTFLVVPYYHRLKVVNPTQYASKLENRLSCGDELALHGYTHLDENPPGYGFINYLIRHVYTQSEGEFFSISAAMAKRRIEMGLEWFAQNKWPVSGFVAPAWLLGSEARNALKEFSFQYTTTQRRFHLLPWHDSIFSPSLVYSVRSDWRRQIWRRWASFLCQMLDSRAQLVRFSLHPVDANYPGIVRHAQTLIEKMLQNRQAMTKAAFANSWVSTQAMSYPDMTNP